jgi:predicted secreted protein
MPSNKTRKAPSESATLFTSGTVKKGSDGNKWMIVTNNRGTRRWQKIKTNTHKKQRKSARVLAIETDHESVWGKNKPLENFWKELASGRKVVIIYDDGSHKIMNVPNSKSAKRAFFDSYDADPNVVAVLSSNMSGDAYEVYLYPKAKDHDVEYIIRHYRKFFKSYGPMPEDLIEKGIPAQRKVMYPG